MFSSGSRIFPQAFITELNEEWVSEERRRFFLWLLFLWGSSSTAAKTSLRALAVEGKHLVSF